MATKQYKRPVVVDLFAGAGGLSLGFEQAGFDVAAAVEIDPIHCAIHHYNFPTSHVICRSVTDLTGNDLRKEASLEGREIDVLCGGAPCQGFSSIGKRALDDPRNQLVHHFCRLVGELKPKYVVFENVKGLTQGRHKKFLTEIIEALQSCGYVVLTPYRVLNAADFGVPQSRYRLFIIAARSDQQLPAYPQPSGRTSVGDALFDLPNADDFETLVERDWVKTRHHKGSQYARSLRGEEPDPSDFSHPRKWDPALLTSSTRTEHSVLSKERFAGTAPGQTEPISRFLRLDPDGVSNTLRAGTDSARGAFTSPRPIHPIHARVITVREAARLHSYPDWFRFHATKWHGFRQIGNSVPPLLGRAVAASVLSALKIKPKKPTKTVDLGAEELLRLDMSQAARRVGVARNVIAQRIRRNPHGSAESLSSERLVSHQQELELG